MSSEPSNVQASSWWLDRDIAFLVSLLGNERLNFEPDLSGLDGKSAIRQVT
jgi:hypothetical protein